MKLLLLGSGGREHALAWKIAQSPLIDKLYIAPGNAGTANAGENVAIKADDFDAVANFVVAHGVDMVVVGPEDPLVKGIYDYFKQRDDVKHVPVIGPSKAGAVLEGSKDFAKGFMKRHNIPTAAYETFDGTQVEEGCKFLETLKAPYVLKADGLCAGKGVLIVPTLDEAKKELRDMLGGMFGNASSRVVIEEFLSGIECSVFVLTDGKHYQFCPKPRTTSALARVTPASTPAAWALFHPYLLPPKSGCKRLRTRLYAPPSTGLLPRASTTRALSSSALSTATASPRLLNTTAAWATPKPKPSCCA